MDPAIAHVLALVEQYGYFVIFPVSVVEGPVITVISGILASLGYLNAAVAFVVLLLGDVAGDVLYYGLGRWGRNGLLPRFGARFGFTEEKLRPFEEKFLHHDWKLLLFAKTQAVGSVILVSAGIVRVPLWRFVWYNVLGSIPKIALFEAAGFYFAQSFARLNRYLDYAGIATFVFAVALVVLYVLLTRYLRRTSGL